MLYTSAAERRLILVKTLLTILYHAGVGSVTPAGSTALYFAAARGHDEMVERLLACVADANNSMTSWDKPSHTRRGKSGSQ